MLFAHVQHGWMLGTGLLDGGREVPWLPKLVWTHDNAAAARAVGHRHVRAIGAPFLYLAACSPLPTERAGGTLVYPHHSWDRDDMAGDHNRYIDEILEREPDGATVCLYWREFEDARIRARYERAGFTVVCHGYRDDPMFLRRVHAAVTGHRRVVSNRVGSALWYAAAVGCEVEVYGPVFVSQETDAEAAVFDRFARATWPEWYDGGLAGADAVELAAVALGRDTMCEPGELRSLLGLDRPPALGQVARAVVHGEHRIRSARARLAAITSRGDVD